MTTLRVKEDTRKKLQVLKDEFSAASYNDLLEKMIDQVKLKISLFGTEPDLPSWEEEKKHVRFDRY